MKIPFNFFLNTQDYNSYTTDISTVAPKNFLKFLYQRVEVFRLLVIMHFYGFLWVYFLLYRLIHSVKFFESNGDLLEYNGSQGANGLD